MARLFRRRNSRIVGKRLHRVQMAGMVLLRSLPALCAVPGTPSDFSKTLRNWLADLAILLKLWYSIACGRHEASERS